MTGATRNKPSSLPRPPRLVALLSVAAALIWIPQAYLLAGVVADVADAPAEAEVVLPLVLFLALSMLRGFADAVSVRIAQVFAAKQRAAIRARIAEVAALWSPADTTRPAAGELAALAADQVEALEPYLTRYQPARVRMTVVPVVIALVVAPVSWAAALILVLAAPFIPVFMSLIGAEARDRSARQLDEVGTLTGHLLDRVSGLATIRLFRAEARAAARIAEAGEAIRKATMAVLRLAFLSSAVLELFSAVSVALVAVYVGFSLLGWINFGTTLAPLTLGSGLFILLLAPDFFQPFRDFASAYHDKAAADALAARLSDLVETPRPTLVSGLGGDALPAVPAVGEPVFAVRGVHVRHPGSDGPLLSDVAFEIRPGEHVAIWGASGAGKSTLLASLAGLMQANGEIRFSGRPLAPETIEAIRTQIAWVGQDPFLAARSLRHNVTLYGGTEADVREALASVGLDRLTSRLPRGLATSLGEFGVGLSGGEARRLAVARALASGRPVILADEPTANLDAETADAVRAALVERAAGRTLIVATHDRRLAQRMDRVLTLVDGRLVEAGVPA